MRRLTRIATIAALLLTSTAGPAAAEPISAAILGIFGITNALAVTALTAGLSFAANLGLSLLARARRKNAQFGVRGETVAGEDVPASFTPGGYCSGGKFEYGGEWGEVDGTPNAFTVDVISFGDLPAAGAVDGFDGFFVNEKPVTLDTDNPHPTLGYPALEFRVGGTDHLWIKPYDGTQTVADPYLLDRFGDHPDYPWSADQVFRGVPYLICTALIDRDLFKGGFPRYKAVPGSTLFYDLRKDSTAGGAGTHRWDDPATWEPSRNPIVQAYNIVRGLYYDGEWFYGGRNLAAHRIPAAAAMAAMNECDLMVALDDDTEEPQFRCAGEIFCDMEPLESLEEIFRSCNGRMTSVAGCIYFLVGAPPAADFAITDGDIVIGEGRSFKPFSPIAEVVNGTSSTYPEPAEAWAPTEAPGYLNAEFVAEDGEELVADISYPFVPFVDQVQRLDITLVADARRERWHEFWLPPLAAATLPGGTLSWTSEHEGYVNKKFTIWKKRGRRNRLQLVLLREVDPTDYDYPEGWRQPTTFTPLTRTVVPTQPMTGWGVEPAYIEDENGTPRRPSVKVHCAANLHDVRNIHVQLRVKATGAVVFDSDSTAYAAPFEWVLNGVFVPATLHQARGRYIPYSGRQTEWSDWLEVLTPDVRSGRDDVYPIDTDWFATWLRDSLEWSMVSARETLARIRELTTIVIDQDLSNFDDKQTLRREVVSTRDALTAAYSEAITVATGPSSALALRIQALEASYTGFATVTMLTTQIARIDAHDGQISVLGANIDSIELELDEKASASSLNAQILRIDANEDEISIHAANIAALDVEVAGKASASSLNAQVLRIDANEDQIDIIGAAVTGLEAEVDTRATIAAVNALEIQVNANEDQIDIIGAAVTGLEAEVDTRATIAAVNALEIQVNANEDQIDLLASALIGVEATLDDVSAGANIRMETLAGVAGYASRIALQARTGGAGVWRSAALLIDVPAVTSLPTRVALVAQQVVVTTSAGVIAAVFDGDTTYIANARIRNLTATNIAVNSLTADRIVLGGLTYDRFPESELSRTGSLAGSVTYGYSGGHTAPTIGSWVTVDEMSVGVASALVIFGSYSVIASAPGGGSLGIAEWRIIRVADNVVLETGTVNTSGPIHTTASALWMHRLGAYDNASAAIRFQVRVTTMTGTATVAVNFNLLSIWWRR